jgi:hypothetical protein
VSEREPPGRQGGGDTAIGVATVRSDEQDFAANAAAQDALEGAAANEVIGQVPDEQLAPRIEFETAVGHTRRPDARNRRGDRAEPLAGRRWDTNLPSPVPPAPCEGTADRNGFYGDGIVDAERIVDAADRDGGRDRDRDSD